MTPEQDRDFVDRIARFVFDDLDMDAAWFAAAWPDIYRRMESLADDAKLNRPNEGDEFSCCTYHRAGGNEPGCGFVASMGQDGKPIRE